MPIAPTKILEMKFGDDPKQIVLEALKGRFDDWRVQKNEVIVATAPAVSITALGIHIPQKSMEEVRFQGTVGLVMKLGRTAFEHSDYWPDDEDKPKIGEWVHYRAASTEEFAINDISCRYIRDDQIHSVVPGPEAIR